MGGLFVVRSEICQRESEFATRMRALSQLKVPGTAQWLYQQMPIASLGNGNFRPLAAIDSGLDQRPLRAPNSVVRRDGASARKLAFI